jgi:hypothetical protein
LPEGVPPADHLLIGGQVTPSQLNNVLDFTISRAGLIQAPIHHRSEAVCLFHPDLRIRYYRIASDQLEAGNRSNLPGFLLAP